jgi:hypothetical protein
MIKKLQDMGKGKDWKVHYYENIEGGHGGAADAKQSAFMGALAYGTCGLVAISNLSSMLMLLVSHIFLFSLLQISCLRS